MTQESLIFSQKRSVILEVVEKFFTFLNNTFLVWYQNIFSHEINNFNVTRKANVE